MRTGEVATAGGLAAWHWIAYPFVCGRYGDDDRGRPGLSTIAAAICGCDVYHMTKLCVEKYDATYVRPATSPSWTNGKF